MSPIGLVLSLGIGISLGFFGGGGSILTVPLLVYVFGQGPKQAIASSLLIVAAASAAALLRHWRAGNVEPRTALLFGAGGMAGAHVGGRAAAAIDGGLLLLLFAVMMVLTALAMWRGRRASSADIPDERSPARLVGQGIGVGLLTGLIGAGGGFLIVPALALWAGLPMAAAIGTSLFIIILNTLAGFAGYVGHVDVDYALIAGVAACAIVGSYLGSLLALRIDPSSLRRAFSGFVLVMAVGILAREANTWITAARAAVPSSAPQLVFALLVLAVGIATGRVSRRIGGDDVLGERWFSEGAGI